MFLAILKVLLCEFLIFVVCHFSSHIPSHIMYLTFLIFQFSRHIPESPLWGSPFRNFSVLSLLSRSYGVLFPFSKFFSVSRIIPGHTLLGVSFFTFFSFHTTIQFWQCVFLIFYVFHCILPYYRSKSVCFLFCTFFSVSRHI